jgi:hypothetical protein
MDSDSYASAGSPPFPIILLYHHLLLLLRVTCLLWKKSEEKSPAFQATAGIGRTHK